MTAPWNGMGAWMGWGWLFFLLVVAGAVLIVVAVVRATGSRTTSAGDVAARPPRAEEILAERYARGEIDKDEYQERLRTLRGD
ncbi:SHOCT domain-containing protein [Actinotalea sp. Marseille-Q4924]|uniref:SHOCT domain-containing protein n=1 Tax=Actinotalea sp. Marseille-Q4924 TaxID=2866571 RepID=UPI001CE3BE44|nr:SHOCT domain-containing protein [Actinotalea sp. Marseille-Q4924]